LKICVIGIGYVGLPTSTCLAEIGNSVICVDKDEEKISKLKNGIMPIQEPGLEELVDKNISEGKLIFTTDLSFAIDNSDIVFITVGTPSLPDGDVNLSQVRSVAEEIALVMQKYKIIVLKSTVLPGTSELVKEIIHENMVSKAEFDIVSNPEFLREGSAIYDTMYPDRIIIGSDNDQANNTLSRLYEPFNAPMVKTDLKTAELIKYASNAFLAIKISFINEIANICEKVGADVTELSEGIGLDKRIGNSFLKAGVGYGGSCLPKDTRALVWLSNKIGYDFKILKSSIEVNRRQQLKVIKFLKDALGELKDKKIVVLGLSFKPGTADMRNAPSIEIIKLIQKQRGVIRAYDPVAMKNARKLIDDVMYCNNVYEAVEGADAVVLLTEWKEFKDINLEKVKSLVCNPIFIDGRNVYDPKIMKRLGFKYYSIGRSR